MRYLALFLTTVISLFLPLNSAYALLNLELTQGVSGAVPIAVVPFAETGQPSQRVSDIINNDLQHSGRFKVYSQSALTMQPTQASEVSFPYFQRLGADNLVVGRVQSLGGDRYQVRNQLLDVFKGGVQPEKDRKS